MVGNNFVFNAATQIGQTSTNTGNLTFYKLVFQALEQFVGPVLIQLAVALEIGVFQEFFVA